MVVETSLDTIDGISVRIQTLRGHLARAAFGWGGE